MKSLLNRHKSTFDKYNVTYLRISDPEKEPDSFCVDKFRDDVKIIYLYNTTDPEKEFVIGVFNLALIVAIKNECMLEWYDYIRVILDEMNEPLTNGMLVYSLELMCKLIDDSSL